MTGFELLRLTRETREVVRKRTREAGGGEGETRAGESGGEADSIKGRGEIDRSARCGRREEGEGRRERTCRSFFLRFRTRFSRSIGSRDVVVEAGFERAIAGA